MTNRHKIPQSPASPKIARLPLPTKTFFDGTKLSVDVRRPQTTTDGINCPFWRESNVRKSHHFAPIAGISRFGEIVERSNLLIG
jgi:hypothetical protein